MPRPVRINFENACYHVMNRGRGRQAIFPGDEYYQMFLNCLAEASKRFRLEVIAYCLMGNHYHLFVKTPLANLDRCMRHVNGLYTQRYNRLKKTDGPLFRGRYKAILVEADTYGLHLSRYIHRNPVEMKRPLINKLDEYTWSSYPCYINKVDAPDWLSRELVYDLLGAKQRYKSYARYVESGIDEETESFYGKGNQPAILGSDEFVQQIKSDNGEKNHLIDQHQGNYPSIKTIIESVAEEFEVEEKEITKSRRGRNSENIPRWVALYLCRELSQAALKEIASGFGMQHISGVSKAAIKLERVLDKKYSIQKSIKRLNQRLTP
ncbi:MAG: putative transposase [Gammaproteobacteria bacterium]|jgi:putative transposase